MPATPLARRPRCGACGTFLRAGQPCPRCAANQQRKTALEPTLRTVSENWAKGHKPVKPTA